MPYRTSYLRATKDTAHEAKSIYRKTPSWFSSYPIKYFFIDFCIFNKDLDNYYYRYYDEQNKKDILYDLKYKCENTNIFIKEIYDNCNWNINNKSLTYKYHFNHVDVVKLVNVINTNRLRQIHSYNRID